MFFLSKLRLTRLASCLVPMMAAAFLSGCMGSDPALNAAPPPGMNNSGTYPQLGAPLKSATTQMSDADAASMGARLQALADAHKKGTISEAEYNRKIAELTKLGQETRDAAKATGQ